MFAPFTELFIHTCSARIFPPVFHLAKVTSCFQVNCEAVDKGKHGRVTTLTEHKRHKKMDVLMDAEEFSQYYIRQM